MRYQPHEEIRNGTLYRRIFPDAAHWVAEEKRATSYNFVPSSRYEYLSGHLPEIVRPEQIFERYPGVGLLEIEVTVVWEVDLRVTYEPEDGEDHVGIWGLKGNARAVKDKRDALCERLLRVWEPGTYAIVLDRSSSGSSPRSRPSI